MRFLVWLQLFLLIFLPVGCGINYSEEQESARIILGESIDGVKIGDNTKSVIDKLGQPDEIGMGDFPGNVYIYTKGIHAGLSVSILSDQEKGVASIAVSNPYNGKSKDGIGIRSNRDYLLQVAGKPNQSGEGAANGSIVDYYFFQNTKLYILYSAKEIETLVLSKK